MLRIVRQNLRSWLDPACFSPASLAETWVREGMEIRFKRFLTVSIVLLLCMNVATIPVAMSVDYFGIDAFLSLMELQFVVGLAILLVPAGKFAWRVAPRRLRTFWIRLVRRIRAAHAWLFDIRLARGWLFGSG